MDTAHPATPPTPASPEVQMPKQLTLQQAIAIVLAALLTSGGAISFAAPGKEDVRTLVREEVELARTQMTKQLQVDVQQAVSSAFKEQLPGALTPLQGNLQVLETRVNNLEKRLEKLDSKIDDRFDQVIDRLPVRR